MECLWQNDFLCAAWLIFNHYSVWRSSWSGPSAPQLVKNVSDGTKSHIFLPVSVSWPACLAAWHNAALDPLCSPSPSQPSLCAPHPHLLNPIHSQLLCRSALVLPVVSVRRSCAFCAACGLAPLHPAVLTSSCSGWLIDRWWLFHQWNVRKSVLTDSPNPKDISIAMI